MDDSVPSDIRATAMEPIDDLLAPVPGTHTMGESLRKYVFQRIHQDILSKDWTEIRVTGSLRRRPPARKALWETDKPAQPFNFQRPTATIISSNTIELHCFPCGSFVYHYGSVVATYLLLSGDDRCVLNVVPPAVTVPLKTLQNSNLHHLGRTDIVILGEIHNLSRLPPGPWWQDRDYAEEDLFAWRKYVSPRGKIVTILGCKEALWGEASDAIIRFLRQISGLKCALYVGKVGALAEGYPPNEWIATGNETVLGDCSIKWKSPLEETVKAFKEVVPGKHVTVRSPLCETQDWLQRWSKTSTWVDCESGHMARAAIDAGVQFGYLHIVSDSLTGCYEDNLSNEDCVGIRNKREILYRRIEDIITSFVSLWDGGENSE